MNNIVITIPRTKEFGNKEFGSMATKSDCRWNAMTSSKNTRHRNHSQSTMPANHHKSIKIPAVHNHKDGDDGEYIRRKIRQENHRTSSRSLDRSTASSKKSRSSRSLDRSAASSKSKARTSRSCDRQWQTEKQTQKDQPPRAGRRNRKLQSPPQTRKTLTKSKSSQLNYYPQSPGDQSLSRTNRSNCSARSTGSGRREPAQRGIRRSYSSRIEKDDPTMSPGSVSKSCKSECGPSGGSPLRRVRKTRSLDASTRSLSREDYILTRSGHKRAGVEREHSESECSLTDTTWSTSTSESLCGSPQRVTKTANPLRSPSYRMRSKSNSDMSKLSTSTRSTASLSSHTSISGRSHYNHHNNNTNHSNHTTHLNSPTPEGLRRVSWKADPQTSFSDWILQVSYRDSNHKRQTNTYNVHKNIVAYGTRKSNSIFRDIMDNELKLKFDSSNGTEVELKNLLGKQGEPLNITKLKLSSESQAQVVPLVLDFMYYTNETNHRMSAERSCNVFKVAEGLKVRALQTAIGEFYEMNLSLKNMGEFLKAATNAKADLLLAICKAKIRQMIVVQPELAQKVPQEFLQDILDHSVHSNRSYMDTKSHRSKKKKGIYQLSNGDTPSVSDIDDSYKMNHSLYQENVPFHS